MKCLVTDDNNGPLSLQAKCANIRKEYSDQGLIYHSHGPANGARVWQSFNFSIDAPMVHLFKSIDLSLELPVWYLSISTP
jgi:hypothetical protein